MRKVYLIIFVILLVTSFFPSCKNDDDSYSEINIYYKCKSMSIADDDTVSTVQFNAMYTWYITIDSLYSDWISMDTYSGTSGKQILSVYTTKNTDSELRTGYVTIHGESQQSTFTITQRGYTVINFKDETFKKYCLDNFDYDKSGFVTTAEAHQASAISCPSMGINDFTGIESFNAIKTLDISDNNALVLSLDGCNSLEKVNCSQNYSLGGIEIGSNMKLLKELDVSDCNLTNLTIDSCVLITKLDCKNNNINSLNFTNNLLLSDVDCTQNMELTRIFVGRDQQIDNLKKEDFTKLVTPDEVVNIPDPVFKEYLLDNYDKDRDNEISVEESLDVDYIRCFGYESKRNQLESLKGIEYFPNLLLLECGYSNINHIDLTCNPKLEEIYCRENPVDSILISAYSPLKMFDCSNCNQLEYLGLNSNSHLTELHANGCKLESIDFNGCKSLTSVYLSHNLLTEFSMTDQPILQYIDCSYNNIEGNLSITGSDSLAYVYCSHNKISSLDVTYENLYDVDCGNNCLSGKMDLVGCEYIHTFACDSNSITTIQLPDSSDISLLDITSNDIESLNLGIVDRLAYLYANYNKIKDFKLSSASILDRVLLKENNLSGELDLSKFRTIKVIWVDKNPNLDTLCVGRGVEQLEIKCDPTVTITYK